MSAGPVWIMIYGNTVIGGPYTESECKHLFSEAKKNPKVDVSSMRMARPSEDFMEELRVLQGRPAS